MRASLILRQLRISFEELLEYGRLLEIDLSDPQFDISEEVFEQIRDLHKNDIVKERVFKVAMANKARKIGAYLDADSYKLPAKIKWFGNQATGGDYGFLEGPELGDIFFHLDDVKGISRNELRPDKFVLVELSKDDFEVSRKKSAAKVTKLEDEEDIYFMLHCFSRIFRSAIGELRSYSEAADTILEQFHKNLEGFQVKLSNKERDFFVITVVQLLEEKYIPYKINGHFGRLLRVFKDEGFKPEKVAEIDTITQNYIFKNRYNFLEFNFVLDFRKFCGLETGWDLDEYIRELAPKDDLYYWWSIQELSVRVPDILDEIAKELNEAPLDQKRNLSRLSDEEVAKILEISFENILNDSENKYSLEKVGDFISLSSQFQLDLDLSLLGSEKLYQLWFNDFIEYFPINAVRRQISIYDIAARKSRVRAREGTSDLELIFKKLTEQEIKDLVASFYYESRVNDKDHFKDLLVILDYIKDDSLLNELKTEVFHNLSDFYRLRFFIADYTDELDFDGAVIYTGLLEAKEQKLFFKKLIKLIEDDALHLSLEDLSRITTVDYETSEMAREIDGVGLDFSLAVTIQLLNDLENNEITKAKTIYDLVAKEIKRPDDLLVIDGFFDKCQGRTILRNDSDSDEYKTERSFERAPRFATFCDGRKATEQSTGKPANCKKSGKEFWWCENAKCYEIARKKHDSKDWRNYNLEDILSVLKIPYSSHQYEILLGVINRVNRFFEHLSCRSCKKILKPLDNGNYGFYRVSNFQCPDPSCEKHNETIYLSHCANGACENIIDSRDSVKCKPEGYHENCGWYICNHCLACCSSEKLRGRQYAYNMTGQEYKCHITGHRDRGILCCNKCGDEMTKNEQYGPMYLRQLKWFIDQRVKHPNIPKSGRRDDGKWWFLWEQGNFAFEEYRKHLENLYKTGFNIPDYHDTSKTSQLIAEPFQEHKASTVFSCSSCGNIYKVSDLSEFDYARQRSIFNYHEKVFGKQLAK